MKRRWRAIVAQWVPVLLAAFWLGGCGAGTEVGNPEYPTTVGTSEREAFVGLYAVTESPFLAPEADGEELQHGIAPLPECPTDAATTKEITAGTKSNEVMLSGFFNIVGLPNPLPAAVSGTTLSISAISYEGQLSCTGTLEANVLTLTCDRTSDGSTDCRLSLQQG